MFRLLHTADWHLGQSLHEQPRDLEHDAFLAWLLDRLEAEAVDALLIAGDVFDTANPSARAEARWYRFLAEARRRRPKLRVVVIGGNHDAPARLQAPEPLVESLGVTVVGALPGAGPEACVVPLEDAGGRTAAWVAAVPFLRPADLPAVEGAADPLIDGVRRVYAEAIGAAAERRAPGQALVAMGHCYMAGGEVSELSERKVQVGNQHALPADLFPDEVAYVALGHLHRAQAVGGRAHLRYPGSPIPLSMAEAAYRHQVLLVELEGEAVHDVRALPVPRAVDLLRLPEAGPGAPEAVLAELATLPDAAAAEGAREGWPLLEVRVRLEGPRPQLRQEVEDALSGKQVRLVKLTVERAVAAAVAGDATAGRRLDDLLPEDVLTRCWVARTGQPAVPDEVRETFHQLIEAVQDGAASEDGEVAA